VDFLEAYGTSQGLCCPPGTAAVDHQALVNGYVPACMCLRETILMFFDFIIIRVSLGAIPNFADWTRTIPGVLVS